MCQHSLTDASSLVRRNENGRNAVSTQQQRALEGFFSMLSGFLVQALGDESAELGGISTSFWPPRRQSKASFAKEEMF